MSPMMRSMMDDGRNRFKTAWLMFAATYSYSMASGACNRWESFTAARSNFWHYLWRPRLYGKPHD